ncbi:M56 family metallopeptidase [Mycolicibacter senuensis]|uniref:Peptidase M48 domain-containing protein n=1 Tax=Mycolicibacter senuensis TaxID=386913 RepID=A0A7I9XP50_9MYCO|nr:M56 family metallopeptidase [Mycolicibacter senuensis]ORW66320.1 peptidase M56 [Mycolicibacter senuensis]GFG71137.1 hypothetical protein MSEN_28570 [Mycolicibacter senuensis]
MNAVTLLLGYAVVLSCVAPALLTWPGVARIPPRLAVTGWLVAVGTTLIAWLSALAIMIVGAIHSVVTNTAMTFCVKTLGIARADRLPPAIATALVVLLLLVTASVALRTARRVVISLRGYRRRNLQHAEAVRIVGYPTSHHGVVAMAADQPTAYCVSGGRRQTVVVTTAALELLSSTDLAAVLAHERAHLRGRHHRIIATLNALAAALPRLPLMRSAAKSVPALLEMCADDAAARDHGRESLLASLLTLSSGHRVPDGALAAAGTAVVDRMRRLMEPEQGPWWDPRSLAMVGIVAVTAAVPGLALGLCTL